MTPYEVVEKLPLSAGMTVVDFGSGTGVITALLAERVGEGGKVYAVEVQKDLLPEAKKQAEGKGLTNVELIWGDIEVRGGTKLADKLADAVILVNVLFQTSSPYSVLLEAKRILKDGGAVAIIDWSDSFGGLGPTPSQVLTPEKLRAVAKEAGLIEVNDFAAGDHHYGLIFRSN